MLGKWAVHVITSILILGGLGLTENAFAAPITVFNDLASFGAVTGSLVEEDFEGLSFCNFDPIFSVGETP